jgi:predicted ATPase
VLTFGDYEANPVGLRSLLKRPVLDRSDLILPKEVFEALDRFVPLAQALEQRLRDSGQHLKSGVLLYCPLGTGKTHIVR